MLQTQRNELALNLPKMHWRNVFVDADASSAEMMVNVRYVRMYVTRWSGSKSEQKLYFNV